MAEIRPKDIVTPRIEFTEVEDFFTFGDGFHEADWERLNGWIERNFEGEGQGQAWESVVSLWVNKLREDLGGGYHVSESREAMLLCDRPPESARWLIEYAGRAVSTIREELGAAAWRGVRAKQVLLVFSEEDDYYQYVSRFGREGEQATSGGMCIHSGYPHIVLQWHDELEAANGLVHELTHQCLQHLGLPLWLNEGVAMTLQRQIAPPPRALVEGVQETVFAASIQWTPPMMWEELAERHFEFWTEEKLQTFWAGSSFFVPGDSNELSYSLAEVFLKLLSEGKDKISLQRFLENARAEDAGQTAALDLLLVDLGNIARTFLGEGNWRPQRKAIAACWEASGWK